MVLLYKSSLWSCYINRHCGVVTAIPLVARYKMEGLEGMQKLLALMNCFRGDLPQVHGIVGK